MVLFLLRQGFEEFRAKTLSASLDPQVVGAKLQ